MMPQEMKSQNEAVTPSYVDQESLGGFTHAAAGVDSSMELEKTPGVRKALGNMLNVDVINEINENTPENRSRSNNRSRARNQKPKESALSKHFYEDLYILKVFDNPEVKDYCHTTTMLISKDEFAQKDGRMRHNDEFWSSLSCIQMTPQTKIGLGKAFKFTFSPICHRDPKPKKVPKQNPKIKTQDKGAKLRAKFDGPIEYDFKQFGDDDVTLQLKNPHAFCLKQCNKMGFYLQMVHQIEILRMDVEFHQDETGLMIFYHAQNIWIRVKETKAKYLRSTTVAKYDHSDDQQFSDPMDLVTKAPSGFWKNLHQGYDSLDRQNSMKDEMRT